MPWSTPGTVAAFARAAPNNVLLALAQGELQRRGALTEHQLIAEMATAGFVPDPAVSLTEYNRPQPGSLRSGGTPVIYEAAFRRLSRG